LVSLVTSSVQNEVPASANGITDTTGPKISSCAMRARFGTAQKMVG